MKHRQKFAIVLTICFFVVAALGFLAMGQGGCIASIASGGTCPVASNPFMAINYHPQLFKSFSNSLFELPIIGFILLLVVGLMFSLKLLIGNLVIKQDVYFYNQFLNFLFLKLQAKQFHWLLVVRNRFSL